MAVETLSIVDSDKKLVHVRARNKQYCDSCAVRAGCGLELLNKSFLPNRDIFSLPLPAKLQGNVQTGEDLILSLDDGKLNIISFMHYVMPITCVVVATACAQALTETTGSSELWVVLSALAGLILGIAGVYFLTSSRFWHDLNIITVSRTVSRTVAREDVDGGELK